MGPKHRRTLEAIFEDPVRSNRQVHAAVPYRGGSDAMMEYKGYIGKVEFDAQAEVFHGEIIDTRDVITFQGQSVAELTKAFRESVDDYLAFCKQRGDEPDKPFSGQFVTRIPPELHRQVNIAAVLAGKSLNAFVTEQLQVAVQKIGAIKAASKEVASKAKQTKAVKTSSRRKNNNSHHEL